MGSRGTYIKDGGFTRQDYCVDAVIHGVKVLRPVAEKSKWGLPFFSNTPQTAYIKLTDEGKFVQFRQYDADRRPLYDIDFGIDRPLTGMTPAYHIHDYVDGVRQKGRFMSPEELKLHERFFV